MGAVAKRCTQEKGLRKNRYVLWYSGPGQAVLEKAGVLDSSDTCELSQGIKGDQGGSRWWWGQLTVLDQLLRLLPESGCFHVGLLQKLP